MATHGWDCLTIIHPIAPDLAHSDFHLFSNLKKFLPGQRQRFQNDREAEMSVKKWFQSPAADFYDIGYKRWSHGITNVSISDINKLKNISILALFKVRASWNSRSIVVLYCVSCELLNNKKLSFPFKLLLETRKFLFFPPCLYIHCT